ncbi:MAG: NTP pyrophosphohydrolase including oxidative damage repair enzyme [Rhodospirillaceae bacterium]|nr:MAG: NTP pyrophosphohydrolase including oxidative damage repair enzyme [Rhodospirillaceae bacterium]
MGFRDHIAACNLYDIGRFRPFLVGRESVGWITHTLAQRLVRFPGIFTVTAQTVSLSPTLVTVDERTAAVAEVLAVLVREGHALPLRREMFPVVQRFGAPELLRLDRSAVPLFGVRAFGIHVNGFVRTAVGLHLWIGRRSRTKAVAPGKLDNLVAGGQPAGLSLMENLIKECAEEADISRTLAETARPVGAITYCMENNHGLKTDCMFCFDLDLPADFVPRNTDGEIESFVFMPVEDVLEIVKTTSEFKFNVNLVILDFAIRHGFMTPEREPDYLDLLFALRGPAQPLPGHLLVDMIGRD